ncbi:MAG: protein-(glutamine-N5) methyltransferase, release factor-specific [Crocinitomicaceae bacterium]|nr:protein-(glutamine-N5) methyltransferase, release factor-specific [Crocinitomicaceae bacterium]|tara:strand:- start:14583 stop:15425 length:843 start_codon:yes stop_codon:yes gene_type:complete
MESYKSLKKHFHQSLNDVFSSREIDYFFFQILYKILKWQKIDYVLNQENFSDSEFLNFLNHAILELKLNRPIQHILGYVSFYDLEIKVNGDVLIPRPETEELVSIIVNDLSNANTLLDIGTGSGCIPLAVKYKFPHLNCIGTDVSIKAIKVAQENSARLGIDVDFIHQDVFASSFPLDSIDILVSNPPYIPKKELSSMSPNVVDYEPHSALFVPDNNPLMFYSIIAEMGTKILNKNGKIYFEIHEEYGDQIVNLLSDLNYSNVLLFQDLQGKNRIVTASI